MRSLPQDFHQVVVHQRLFLSQSLSQVLQFFFLLREQCFDSTVLFLHNAFGLLINLPSGLFTVGLVELLAGIVLAIGHQAQFGIHAIDCHHGVGHFGDLVQIIRSSSGNLSHKELFGCSAAQSNGDLVQNRFLGEQAHLGRQVLSKAQSPTGARLDGDLQQGIRMLQEPACDCMTRFVNCHGSLVIFAHQAVVLGQSSDDPLRGPFEILHGHRGRRPARGKDRGLIANIGNVSPSESWSQSRHPLSHILLLQACLQGQGFQVNHVDLLPLSHVRPVDRNLSVKTSRPQQRVVQDIHAVGAR
mmetsp:Transcript_8485/g.19006  ORF Transcript_8485/g.19006 Transcript_8485/m.19006 type:complete len:301 (-) Transcript_8485:1459-2361(-)